MFAKDAPRPRRTLMLALTIPNHQVHEGVATWVREHDWNLDVTMIYPGLLPMHSHYDGVLTTVNRMEVVDWLAKCTCPIVRMIGTPSPEIEAAIAHYPQVIVDDHSVGVLGARHLLRLGQPTFAFYQRTGCLQALAVQRGFVTTLKMHGRTAQLIDFYGDHPELKIGTLMPQENRLGWLREKVRALPLPAAIMAEDDRRALELVTVIRDLGLRIPQDIAVLGSDDNRLMLSSVPVEISSVDANFQRVGYVAAEMLAGIIMGAPAPRQPFLISARTVMGRESTATYFGHHAGVNAALSYLRQNFRQDLSAVQIAKKAGLSLRGLQKALQQEAGLNLQSELIRLRLAAASQHLIETDLKLDAIAADVGLRNAKHLCRLFKQHYQTTPQQWRENHQRTC